MTGWINDVPIRMKAFAAWSVLLICLVGLGAYALLILKKWEGGLTRLSRADLLEQHELLKLTNRLSAVELDVFRYAAWSNNSVSDALLQELRFEISAQISLISAKLDDIAAQGRPAEAFDWNGLIAKWEKYKKATADTIEVARLDPPMGTMMLGGTDDDFQRVAQDLQNLSDLVSKRTQGATQALVAEAEKSEKLITRVGLVGVLLSLATAFLVARSIVSPIRAVTAAMMQVARGRTMAGLEAGERQDEIGQMLRAIALFRQKVEHDNAKIEHMARHDALTHLPNRVLFKERLEDALARVRRGERIAVLCLDLDHFKNVNDTLGHPVGDLLLTRVSERLRACLRGTDTVARLSGDEFAIIQVALEHPDDAAALARRIIAAIAEPFDLDGDRAIVGASVGIALSPGDGADPDRLLKCADTALYRAKSEGRAAYRFFEAEMDQRLQARRALELALRSALPNGELELHYQPLVNVQTGQVAGFEALLRWRHPEHGLVMPGEFVPLAEEIGLIVPIGEWVLRQACSEAATWPERCKVAVNVSAAQFRNRSLVATVVGALAESGLAASRLEVEITESVLLDDSETTFAALKQLHELGVKISMDDFGTGYSSLKYLQKFPFHKIKIDRSFVENVANKQDSLAVVRAVASLGKSLGIITTAEGVETEEQLSSVKAEGCDEVQGYYFSAAKSAEETRTFIAKYLDRIAA